MEPKEIVKYLINLHSEKKLAHAFLIETNNVKECCSDLLVAIKHIFCSQNYKDNCDRCNLCHLIENQLLPSLIIIEPDGKNIKKEAIENLKKAFSTKSQYTAENIYVMKYPEKMNDTAFNKMLKFVEEPEENIIGFFITENKDYVANTIVSRCEILKMNYKNNDCLDKMQLSLDKYKEYESLLFEYQNLLENDPNKLMWYNNNVLLKDLLDRIEVINFLKLMLDFNIKTMHTDTNFQKSFQVNTIIEKYLERLNYNVNLSLLLDSLAIELGEVYGK